MHYKKRATILVVTALGLAGFMLAVATIKPTSAQAAVYVQVASNVSLLQSAQPSYYRPFPNGIDPRNATHAWQEIADRAAWDDQYAGVIAGQTGASSYAAADYQALGYQNGMAGTSNSALSGVGAVVGMQDHNGSGSLRVLVVINVKTQKTVAFMVRCGNPRLRLSPLTPVIPWHAFSKSTVLYINRTVTKPANLTCPSGQTIIGTLTVTLKGIVRAKTWGKVKGDLQAHLTAAFTGQVKVLLKQKCGPAPPPVTTTTTNTVTTATTVTTTTTTTTTQTTTTTAPPPAPKPLVEVNTVQEITASDYSVNPPKIRYPRLCGSIKTQPGDLLKVSFSGHEGTFDNPNLPDMTADGTKQQVCNTYTSGTEVGTAIDWITISVVDVTAKTSNSADSNHFDVVKADSNPSNP